MKKDMSYRNPKGHRGINANGSHQSGGGASKSSEKGMAPRKGSSMKMSKGKGY